MRARHIAATMLVLGLTVAAFLVARTLSERDAQRDSERRAEVAAAQILGRIEQATSLTESLRRYMLDAGGTGVTGEQFARSALRWLTPADFPAAAWAEQVQAADRAEYERRTGQPIVTRHEPNVRAPSSPSYLPATLVSGFAPLDLRGVDLSREPGIAAALLRATSPGGVAATPVTEGRARPGGLFLVAPAPNLIDGVLRPGAVVVFVAEATLRASAGNPPGPRLVASGRSGAGAGENSVRKSFFVAQRRFAVVMPMESVSGPAAALPWIILAGGLVLSTLALGLGVTAGRRVKAQAEVDRIFSLSSDLIAVADFEGHFTRVNPAVEQILGYRGEEFLAKPYLDLVHPDDREATAAEAAEIARGKPTLSFENRFRHKDGSYRVLEWTATPVLEDGLMYGVARDITPRRRAEAEREKLAEEQAALRRVAVLVAEAVPPHELFGAVTREVGTLLGGDYAGMARFADDGVFTVATWAADGEHPPVPERWETQDGDLATTIARKRRATRWTDWSDVPGPIAAFIRELGIRCTVGTPIVVEGRVWGALALHSTKLVPLPADTESRMAQFTDLVATAVANAEARAATRALTIEQAGLRRVATLVAAGGSPNEIFAAVGDEVRQLIGNDLTSMFRCEPGGMLTLVAVRARAEPVPDGLVGARIPMRAQFAKWLETGQLVRLDERATAEWIVDLQAAEPLGLKSAIGAPIVAGGRPWGAIFACDTKVDGLPQEAERPFTQFTKLVATAISNAQARSELSELADEQAALRRVATLVAGGGSRRQVFNAIAEEMRQLIGADFIDMLRYEDDRTAVSVASGGVADQAFAVGSRHELGGHNATSLILHTRQPVRIDDYDVTATGPIAETARRWTGIRSVVGTPLIVDDRLWGAVTLGTTEVEPLPPDTEARLGQFTELMATAIANIEARAEVERLADEQAALRRLATLVAQGASPDMVLDAVAAEMERLLVADAVAVGRYESDEEVTVVAHRSPEPQLAPVGTRLNYEGHNISAIVRRTGRPARLEALSEAGGGFLDVFRGLGSRALVGTPIVVEGRLWGTIVASWNSETPPPADTEERMARFAELLETAIANADSRNQLTASRARLVTAFDEARRRVVRDLHDGAQQRLVHTIVTLKLAKRAFDNGDGDGKAESLVGEALEQAERSNAELRELAHGILPSVLTRGGLRAGVDSVVERIDLPVDVDIPDDRLPTEVEASAYLVIAEALTNVMKHADAGSAHVRASVNDGTLCVEVRDDGTGGADPDGHGLVGVKDRVTALGGRLEVKSPVGGGTLLSATLPLSAG